MRARTLEGRRIGLPFLFLDLRVLRRVSVREWLRQELVWDLGGIDGEDYVVWKKWLGSAERDIWSWILGWRDSRGVGNTTEFRV